MTTKEATVYIVDVGRSMNTRSNGRQVTDLEWALEYVWDKVTTTIATDRKTCHIGVIGLRTDETSNDLDSGEAYAHLSVFRDLGQMLMPDLRRLRDQLRPSNTDEGDAISALVLAIQMIGAHCRALQYVRQIILVTNGMSSIDPSDLEDIAEKIKQDGMRLTVLGVDFDDSEFGFKEEAKPAIRATNERILGDLVRDVGGEYGTLAQAIDELSIPRIKTVRPTPSYKGYLTLGDPEKYDSAMSIDVERYPKVMVATTPSASSFVVRNEPATQRDQTEVSGAEGDGLAAVKRARIYQVPDADAPGGKKDVEEEDLAKGYAYGSTAVHISESDRTVTTFETKPGMSIVGFVDRNRYHRYMDMTKSSLIIAQRTNPKAALAFSSLIHALHELDSCAVARYVSKENRPPVLLLLTPHIEKELECLYDTELPFAEDIRSYRFPPLDRIITVSGKTITQHRNLPTPDLQDAMASYINAMDMTSPAALAGTDETELADMDDTFSPVLHRLNQCIRHRAVHPSSTLPPIPPILTKHSHPPPHLLTAAQAALDTLITTAALQRVPAKAQARRTGRSARRAETKPLSGLDVDALLASDATTAHSLGRATVPDGPPAAIDPLNAVPDFEAALDRAHGPVQLADVLADMAGAVERLVRDHSFGSAGYGRAAEALAGLRRGALEMDEVGWWNGWVRGFKGRVFRGELGEGREEFWVRVREARLGLVEGEREGAGGVVVGAEEARRFLVGRL